MNGPSFTPVPTLDELAADPAKIAGLPPDAARAYLYRVTALVPALAMQASAGASHAPDGLLTVPEVAARLGGLSQYRVYELIRQGQLKRTAVGRRVLVHPSDMEDYIARCRA
jgi:excisionase family DNA binding protein